MGVTMWNEVTHMKEDKEQRKNLLNKFFLERNGDFEGAKKEASKLPGGGWTAGGRQTLKIKNHTSHYEFMSP